MEDLGTVLEAGMSLQMNFKFPYEKLRGWAVGWLLIKDG